MSYSYIRSSGVRKLVKENEKRCGSSFLQALDKYIYEKIMRCLKEHNGNRKTLDATLVSFTK